MTDTTHIQQYTCHICNGHFTPEDAKNPSCPECGDTQSLTKRCRLDPIDGCTCLNPVLDGIKYCPECNEAICPVCGCHDVEQISRITGYMNAISGFNKAKKQEVKDRVRTDPATLHLLTWKKMV